AGAEDRAASAYHDLGKAASDGGQVALAVGCAWWLRQSGARHLANQLIELIAEAHGAASIRTEGSLRPAPPAVPERGRDRERRNPDREPTPAEDLGEALARAERALATAAQLFGQRDRGKVAPTVLSALTLGSLSKFVSVMHGREYLAGELIVEEGA